MVINLEDRKSKKVSQADLFIALAEFRNLKDLERAGKVQTIIEQHLKKQKDSGEFLHQVELTREEYNNIFGIKKQNNFLK